MSHGHAWLPKGKLNFATWRWIKTPWCCLTVWWTSLPDGWAMNYCCFTHIPMRAYHNPYQTMWQKPLSGQTIAFVYITTPYCYRLLTLCMLGRSSFSQYNIYIYVCMYVYMVVSWNRGSPSHHLFLDRMFPNKNQPANLGIPHDELETPI